MTLERRRAPAFNRLKTLEAVLPALRPRVKGWFTLVASKLDGTSRVLAHFPNLVTDAGLNRMGIGEFRNLCVVGTGSNAPNVTDSQLQTTTARTSTGAPNVPGATAQSTEPYFGQTNTGFRFAVGAAAGNLTEVGIGWSIGSGLLEYQLWARALILDELGDPTAVTVLADEVLDVYYAIRIYPPLLDEEYQVVIGGETYDCVSRAAVVTSVNNWIVPSSRVLFGFFPGSTPPGVFSGALGAITGAPSGLAAYNAGITNLEYSNNSLRQDATFNWGLDQGNVTGGIRSIYYQTGVGAYQTSFTLPVARGDGSTTINKDNTKVLSIGFRVGWARHV